MTESENNGKEVTSEQEERVWEHIDALYSKLEEGRATEDELKRIDDISRIIMDVTGKSCEGNQATAMTEETAELLGRELEMLLRTIGMRKTRTMKTGRTVRTMERLRTMRRMRRRPDTSARQAKREKRVPFSRGMKYASAGIAAGVLLLLRIAFYAGDRQADSRDAMAYEVIQCRNDSVLHLADGTVVHLAGGSHLRVADNFGKKDRTVNLVGEAFFEVAKDPEKSFIVKTKEIDAIVHGTSFNVAAYGGTVESRVAVRTGCVEVARGKHSFGKFHVGDRVVYDEAANRATRDTVNPEHIGTWTIGEFVLEDATVEELKARMRNRFHRELVIEGGAIPANARINYYSYKPGPSEAENVIKTICAVYGARYEIGDHRIVVSRQ